MPDFPTSEWVVALVNKLNTDEQYAKVARNWEGDMRFVIEPDAHFAERVLIYLDLWHGKCLNGFIETEDSAKQPAFILKAPYTNFARVVKGELDPMQALLTRKLGVEGSKAVLMRSIPVVIDFVRCCREITSGIL